MNLIPPLLPPFGYRTAEDGLLCLLFLLGFAAFLIVCFLAVRWFLPSLSGGDSSSPKKKTLSKGASR